MGVCIGVYGRGDVYDSGDMQLTNWLFKNVAVNKGFNELVHDNQPCLQHVTGSCSGSPLMS